MSLMDLTVLKDLLSEVAVVITPSTLIAICCELETPIGSLPDLGWGVTANFKLVCCRD